jgi:ABC-2 type transport system ATP-binding protein
MHGGTDRAYCDSLVKRFEFGASKKVRALSKGNRQKIQLSAGGAISRSWSHSRPGR